MNAAPTVGHSLEQRLYWCGDGDLLIELGELKGACGFVGITLYCYTVNPNEIGEVISFADAGSDGNAFAAARANAGDTTEVLCIERAINAPARGSITIAVFRR